MNRADRLTISAILLLAALLIWALLLWEPLRYRDVAPAVTPAVVTVTPSAFDTPQQIVTMSPPVPHHTASPARFDHLPRAVVTPVPTPTTLPALILVDPTETPEPTVTPTQKPAVQKG